MNIRRTLIGSSAALLLSTLGAVAMAQFGFPGMVRLPPDDFTWMWGDRRESTMGRRGDFSVSGSEASFRCELEGRLSPSRPWSPTDIRQLESNLRTSMAFIQDAANTMYIMDQQRQLDWARLACVKPEDPAHDSETKQELEDNAREKAERRRERRRAREARDSDG